MFLSILPPLQVVEIVVRILNLLAMPFCCAIPRYICFARTKIIVSEEKSWITSRSSLRLHSNKHDGRDLRWRVERLEECGGILRPLHSFQFCFFLHLPVLRFLTCIVLRADVPHREPLVGWSAVHWLQASTPWASSPCTSRRPYSIACSSIEIHWYLLLRAVLYTR